jgi:hypothetical protein
MNRNLANKKLIAVGLIAAFVAVIACGAIMPARDHDHGIIATGVPVASTLPRIAQIVIASDVDWDTYDSGGDGSAGNPWIIENFLIEDNDTGTAVMISGTTDHAIIRNAFINESGAGATDAAILITNAANIDVINCTIEDAGMYSIMFYQNVDNCSARQNTITRGVDTGITFFDTVTNSIITNNTVTYTGANYMIAILTSPGNNTISYNFIDRGGSGGFSGIGCTTSDNVTIANNTIYNTYQPGGGSIGVAIQGCDNIIVTGNVIVNASMGTSSVGTNNTISFNMITCNETFSHLYDASIGIDVTTGSINTTVNNNTIWNAMHAIEIFGIGTNYTTFVNNTVMNCTWGVYAQTSSVVIASGNYFDLGIYACGEIYDSTVTNNHFYRMDNIIVVGTNNVFDSNYYYDYFDHFPTAITGFNMSELEFDYTVAAGVNDTHPRYHAPWYPRGTQVFFNFFSNVDGLGIPFTNLHVELNGIPLTVTDPVIPFVLYHLDVEDYRGRLLYDEILNLNGTGIYVNIGMDIAVQIFVSYYSTLDVLGFDFTDAKLYVDGVRTMRFDPIMDHEIINFTVRDFANRILYDQTLNLSVTGVYVDIGLAITTLVVHNAFNSSVIFHYSISGVQNSFPMAGGQYVQIRIALGTYQYWVTDLHGNDMEDENGHDIDDHEHVTGPAVVDFGWTAVAPPDPIDTYTSSVLDYLIVFAALGGGFGFIAIAGMQLRIKKGRHDGMVHR